MYCTVRVQVRYIPHPTLHFSESDDQDRTGQNRTGQDRKNLGFSFSFSSSVHACILHGVAQRSVALKERKRECGKGMLIPGSGFTHFTSHGVRVRVCRGLEAVLCWMREGRREAGGGLRMWMDRCMNEGFCLSVCLSALANVGRSKSRSSSAVYVSYTTSSHVVDTFINLCGRKVAKCKCK